MSIDPLDSHPVSPTNYLKSFIFKNLAANLAPLWGRNVGTYSPIRAMPRASCVLSVQLQGPHATVCHSVPAGRCRVREGSQGATIKTLIEAASSALDNLGEAVLGVTNDDRPFNEIWGWNCPALTRHNIADIVFSTASKVRAFHGERLDSDDHELLSEVPSRVDYLIANVVPQLPGANGQIAVPTIEQFCAWIIRSLPEQPPSKVSVDWKEAVDKKLLPTDLSRRLRSIEASLTKLEPRSAHISTQIQTIADAHTTAENLPTLLDDLEEARKHIADAIVFVDKSTQEIKANAGTATEHLGDISKHNTDATALISQLGDAYRATNTKGLAASFARKALTLNATLYVWTGALAGALFIGGMIAHSSIETITRLLDLGDVSTGRLLIQLLLTLAGVLGPVWFAWVATKQIGQRFRLAEDYGFKASVAKAYEGYKLEAVRLDPSFEKRLFASALTRLEEAPLRLVEHESFGSPWHELLNSPAFQRAMEKSPELKSDVLRIAAATPAALAGLVRRSPPAKNDVSDAPTAT